ncbi:MAG: holo-ACP synthase [Eggerthellaceae bacterium]
MLMTVGLGVDIVEIARMRRVMERTPSFAAKVFTEGERAYCESKANPTTHYAARFAAKEAVCKALGSGILVDGMRMTDVEVVRDSREARRRLAWASGDKGERPGRS